MQVKLAYQESELVALLKRIPLGPAELAVIKDRAEKLRDGKLKLRGEALLPLSLASFIFDSLCLPGMGSVILLFVPSLLSLLLYFTLLYFFTIAGTLV